MSDPSSPYSENKNLAQGEKRTLVTALAPSSEEVFQEVVPSTSENEVDVTLIRWMLSLSPLQRLQTAQRYANSARKLRNAPRRIRF